MKPGEVITKNEEIDLNKDSKVTKIKISNSGDRPVQVGSHYPVSYTHLTLPTRLPV